ncbi:hypothetical protein BBJ28_00026006 [Nothophytophthora sp. Chile5]|nr:hypothetical protein BBJ28_00026006 [Nothophytophthora sp. Chile5]
MLHFPFLLTKKTGIAKSLMEIVNDGMMSPNGVASSMSRIERRRQNRYYKLLCLFADGVRQSRARNPTYFAPTPHTMEEYTVKNNFIDNHTLTAAWMEYTEYSGSLCEKVMQNVEVRKVLRMNHSVKFCKRLHVWKAGGTRESIKDAKMLLLLMNEIGQIVGRRLTRSENHEETRQLLQHVAPQLRHDDTGEDGLMVVSDNASAVRNMVASAFEGAVSVKQDPFHVIERITEKITPTARSKCVSKELKTAIYKVDFFSFLFVLRGVLGYLPVISLLLIYLRLIERAPRAI